MAVAKPPRGLEIEPLNLTPLLDVLFNLIFFFLFATQLKEEQRVMEVQIPKSGVHRQAPNPDEELLVTINQEGKILFGEDFVTTGELKQRLTEAGGPADRPLPVRIRCDQGTPAQFLFDIMTVSYESGHPNCFWDVKPTDLAPPPP